MMMLDDNEKIGIKHLVKAVYEADRDDYDGVLTIVVTPGNIEISVEREKPGPSQDKRSSSPSPPATGRPTITLGRPS